MSPKIVYNTPHIAGCEIVLLRRRGLPSDWRCVSAGWQQELIRVGKAESLKDEMGNCLVSESQDAFEHNRDG